MSRPWLLTMVMTCSVIGATGATSDARPIPVRQRHQQARILQGWRSGQLTRPEFRRLERGQAYVARLATRLRLSGGVFAPRERAIVQRALDRQSRIILRERHDWQRR